LLSASVPARASVAEERKIGDNIMKKVRANPAYLFEDFEVTSLVREIGNRLVATLGQQPFKYEFNVIRDDTINAFAIPGGKIFVHAGLLARIGSEDELAGLLGHEIAHVNAHHAIRMQQKSAAANYASLLGLFAAVVNPILGQAALAAGQTVKLKYQRDMEREADFLGVHYAEKAGYNPHAMLNLLRVIYNEQKLDPASVPPYFLSHPLTGERMANLESTLKKLEWQGPAPVMSWRLARVQAIARANSQTRWGAVPDYERRLDTASAADRPEALELIGVLMAQGEDYGMAERYLEEAEKDGRNVDRELGRTYARRGKLAQAAVRLERRVRDVPGDWDALADLGTVEYQQGRYGSAVEHLRTSLKLSRYRPEVQRELGRAYEKDGNAGRGYYYFAVASEQEQNAPQAFTYYTKALENLPEDDSLRKTIEDKVSSVGKKVHRPPERPGAHRDDGDHDDGGGPGLRRGPTVELRRFTR